MAKPPHGGDTWHATSAVAASNINMMLIFENRPRFRALNFVTLMMSVLVTGVIPTAATEAADDDARPPAAPPVPAVFQPSTHTLEALAAAGVGDVVVLPEWPVAEDDLGRVALRRVDMYAPDARVFEVAADGVHEIERSPRLHFVGEAEERPGVRMMVAMNPDGSEFVGVVRAHGRTLELEPIGNGRMRGYRLVDADLRAGLKSGHSVTWGCGFDEGGDAMSSVDHVMPLNPPPVKALSLLHTATIAVDTDTELLSQKFGGSTSQATNYIGDLIAAMNVMYERDLNVRLLQGTTFLRTSSDPYSETTTSAGLTEFRSYWRTNYGYIDRALAMMLSGKSPSPYSAAGVAWINGLCNTSYGYSYSQVFKISYLAGDAKLVGHELGHNFGSPHTHCYNPPIDTCYASEGGCYAGPTSCPGGPGTVMSYCHLTGCGSTLDLHPTVIALIDQRTSAAAGVCLAPGEDTSPPIISGVEADPRITTPGTPVMIRATITDIESGVGSATATVRRSGGTLMATLPMSNAGGSTWQATYTTSGSPLDTYSISIQAQNSSAVPDSTTSVSATSFELRSSFECDLTLSGLIVSGAQTWEACGYIIAGPSVRVTGDAHLIAGERVILRNGFSVASGATFSADHDPLLH